LACHNLDIHGGRIAGKIECSGDFNFEGESHVTGGIRCKNMHVQEKSSLASIHPIICESALIEGTTTANIECSGTIVIGPKGLLVGDVVARAFKIMPGGSLEGSTQIANADPKASRKEKKGVIPKDPITAKPKDKNDSSRSKA